MYKSFLKIAGIIPIGVLVLSLAACQKKDNRGSEEVAGDPIDNSDDTKEKALKRDCGAGVDGPAIIGGQKLSSASRIARGVVALYFYKDKKFTSGCTGTLIADNVVLTAAHCVEDFEGAEVVFSTDPLCDIAKNTVVKIHAKEYAEDPEYKKFKKRSENPNRKESEKGNLKAATISHDLALIKMDAPAPQGVIPFKMLNTKYVGSSADKIFVAGYGKAIAGPSEKKDPNPQFLRFAEFPLVDIEPGTTFAENEILNAILGAQFSTTKGFCFGDSGGPGFMATAEGLQIVGVNSVVSGQGESICATNGYLANVTQRQDFIQKALKKMTGVAAPPEEEPIDPAVPPPAVPTAPLPEENGKGV